MSGAEVAAWVYVMIGLGGAACVWSILAGHVDGLLRPVLPDPAGSMLDTLAAFRESHPGASLGARVFVCALVVLLWPLPVGLFVLSAVVGYVLALASRLRR